MLREELSDTGNTTPERPWIRWLYSFPPWHIFPAKTVFFYALGFLMRLPCSTITLRYILDWPIFIMKSQSQVWIMPGIIEKKNR